MSKKNSFGHPEDLLPSSHLTSFTEVCQNTQSGEFSLRDVIRGSDASPSLETPPSPVCLLPNMWDLQLHKLVR